MKNDKSFLNSIGFKKEWLNLLVILFLIVIVSIFFFKIIKIFIIPLLLAITFTTIFYPIYNRLLQILGNKRGLTAFLLCIAIIFCCLVPLYFIGHLVVLQGVDFFHTVERWADINFSVGQPTIIQRLNKIPFFNSIKFENIDIQSTIEEIVKLGSTIVSQFINKTSTGVFEIAANVFFIFYAMFYLFRDGEKILKKVRCLSPLRDTYEDKLIDRFRIISSATIKGTVLIGLIQGIAGAVTFIVFGVPGWILWGFIMIILSILPVVGTYFIMIPVAVYKIAIGDIWQGIVIIVIALVFNYVIDYVLRPILVGRESKMHDLLIFISTLGGIAAFGIMGFIIGPAIAMFFITLIDIYSIEFKDLLH